MANEKNSQIIAFICDIAANGHEVKLSGGLGSVRVDLGEIDAVLLREMALKNFKEIDCE